MNTINSIRSANEQKVPKMTRKIGNTTYEIYVHFSKTSKETMTDKIMRLIRNEINSKDKA